MKPRTSAPEVSDPTLWDFMIDNNFFLIEEAQHRVVSFYLEK